MGTCACGVAARGVVTIIITIINIITITITITIIIIIIIVIVTITITINYYYYYYYYQCPSSNLRTAPSPRNSLGQALLCGILYVYYTVCYIFYIFQQSKL